MTKRLHSLRFCKTAATCLMSLILSAGAMASVEMTCGSSEDEISESSVYGEGLAGTKVVSYEQTHPASCGPATLGSALLEMGVLEKFDKKDEDRIYGIVSMNNMQLLELADKVKSEKTNFRPAKKRGTFFKFLSKVVSPFLPEELKKYKYSLPVDVAKFVARHKDVSVTIYEGQERWKEILDERTENGTLVPATMLNAHKDTMDSLEKKNKLENLKIQRTSPTIEEIHQMLDSGDRILYVGLFYDEERIHYNLIRKDETGKVVVMDPSSGSNVQMEAEEFATFIKGQKYINTNSRDYQEGVTNTGIMIRIEKLKKETKE